MELIAQPGYFCTFGVKHNFMLWFKCLGSAGGAAGVVGTQNGVGSDALTATQRGWDGSAGMDQLGWAQKEFQNGAVQRAVFPMRSFL